MCSYAVCPASAIHFSAFYLKHTSHNSQSPTSFSQITKFHPPGNGKRSKNSPNPGAPIYNFALLSFLNLSLHCLTLSPNPGAPISHSYWHTSAFLPTLFTNFKLLKPLIQKSTYRIIIKLHPNKITHPYHTQRHTQRRERTLR